MALCPANKLDFIPAASEDNNQFLPTFDWRAIGAVFALKQGGGSSSSASSAAAPSQLKAAKLSGRCSLTIREGFDPIDATSTGRVLEGGGDAGITLRSGSSALTLSATNLAYRTGLDDPLAASSATSARVGDVAVPGLKLTLAKEYAEECYAALSFDLTQRWKPELALGWAGSTQQQQAALVVHADPLYRTYKLSASASFPGPEWRASVVDRERAVIEDPEDDGGRHRIWAQHTVKDRQWAYRTRVGAALDLGRLLNNVGEFADNHIEPRIPPLVWRIPLLHWAYCLLVPGQDEKQVRYHVKGWDLEGTHEFGSAGVQLGLAKHLNYATIRGAWHTGSKEASLQYKRSGLSVIAKLARQEGGAGGWGAPMLMLQVEPLGLL